MTNQKRLNNLVWFELPVTDLDRAASFYETVFATVLSKDDRFPGLAIFPRRHETAATGALAVSHDPVIEGRPSTDGAVVYLNCDGEMDAGPETRPVRRRPAPAGSSPAPGGLGYIAQFRDLDGNRVGLHAAY